MEQTERWDHNNHYHHYLLNQLPSSIEQALDIGCGYGEFASHLAERAAHVDAMDVDIDVINGARQRHAHQANLRFIHGEFVGLDWAAEHYQIVTSIAAIHHMELASALEEMKRVLELGGVLVILGLYRNATMTDCAFDMAGVITHAIYSRFIHRDNSTKATQAAPIMEPLTTLTEIKATANAIIPGARIRRHLLWRYSLVWRKP